MGNNPQKELLLRIVTRLAEKHVSTGVLRTFAATVGRDRDVQVFMPDEGNQLSSFDELEEFWVRELRNSIRGKDCNAVAYCVDLTFEGVAVDRTALVHVEQKDGSAENILYRYALDSELRFAMGQPVIEHSPAKIFIARQTPSGVVAQQ